MQDDISKLEIVYPFESLFSAISYYVMCNPARQKYLNIHEPDRKTKAKAEDFTGYSPKDIHASLTLGINQLLKEASKDEYWIFTYRYLAPSELDSSFETIAKIQGMHERKVRRICKKMEDNLLRIFAKRHLINPQKLQELLNTPDKHIN